MARLFYFIFVAPLSHLPLCILYRISDLLYILLITLIPYRKKVIEENILRSFPELDKSERTKLKRDFYRHFADILIEGIKNLSISKVELEKRMILQNPEIMKDLFEKNKNVILVSGHFNNWEWLITAQSFLIPHKAFGIGMPLTNQFWDKKLMERRSRFGMSVIHAKNYKSELMNYTEKPFAVLALSDQAPGDSTKSYWTDFLNQKTPVLFGAEFMANEFDLAVVYFTIHKVKRGYYSLELKLLSDKPKTLDYGYLTSAHTTLLEKDILLNPSHWLWSHKRWKRAIPENLEILKEQQKEQFDKRFRSHAK